jgi:hypothetical protein
MDQTCWIAPGAKRLTRELSRWDFKIHVWAYIGTDGVRCIRLVTGAVTGDTYLKLLRDTIGRRQWRKDKVWQQDNAPAHTAKIVKTFLNKKPGKQNNVSGSPSQCVLGTLLPISVEPRLQQLRSIKT